MLTMTCLSSLFCFSFGIFPHGFILFYYMCGKESCSHLAVKTLMINNRTLTQGHLNPTFLTYGTCLEYPENTGYT